MSTSVKACPSRTSFSSRGTQKHSLQESPLSTTPNLHWIAGYIWGIADDVLRDVYVRGKYRDVILPMTVAATTRRGARTHPEGRSRQESRARRDRARQPEDFTRACVRTGLLQHLEVHAPRPARPGQPAATHRYVGSSREPHVQAQEAVEDCADHAGRDGGARCQEGPPARHRTRPAPRAVRVSRRLEGAVPGTLPVRLGAKMFHSKQRLPPLGWTGATAAWVTLV